MKDFMIGALLGGTAGAACALLLAPVSGSKLRENVISATHRKKHPSRRTLAKKRHHG